MELTANVKIEGLEELIEAITESERACRELKFKMDDVNKAYKKLSLDVFQVSKKDE